MDSVNSNYHFEYLVLAKGTPWVKENPERWEKLQDIAVWNENAFKKANVDVYNKQKAFCDNHIEPEYRIGGGIFTTLSANRYHVGQSGKMGAHVDSGDLNAGMTTMSCFRETHKNYQQRRPKKVL